MINIEQLQPAADYDSDDAVERASAQSNQRAKPFSRFITVVDHPAIDGWLERNSITLLRISFGAVLFGFGILKYFPGLSPAEPLIDALTDQVTFMLVPGRVAMVATATVECVIGLSLISGWGLRVIIYLVPAWALGVLSPAVLLFGRMFSGPDHGPTLEGQYVFKDVILLAASLVIAAAVRRSQKAGQVRTADRYDSV